MDNIAIIITDGKATRDTQFTKSYADEAKLAGVRMLAVGITDSVNASELSALASYPQQYNTFAVNDFVQLTSIVKKLQIQTCEPVMTTRLPVTTGSS